MAPNKTDNKLQNETDTPLTVGGFISPESAYEAINPLFARP